MEQNQFDGLEEVEQDESLIPEKAPELKEYEKLLLAENNRALAEKAINLVKYGCFSQKEEPVVDFSKYTRIDMAKKFKGLYNLYQDDETMELVFICPLVENNKGDTNEKKDMAPYAYDCIITEAMDEETYEMVKHAAKNNINGLIPVLRIAAYVAYLLVLALGVFMWLDNFLVAVDNQANNFNNAVVLSIYYTSGFFAADVLGLPLLALMEIKYRKYKER